jgi:hypothetical protein
MTQFSDISCSRFHLERMKNMSEYYLADRKAEERQRQRDAKPDANAESQNVKVTLLGDFLFPTAESNGCDPYNSTQGKSAREVWKTRRDRR